MHDINNTGESVTTVTNPYETIVVTVCDWHKKRVGISISDHTGWQLASFTGVLLEVWDDGDKLEVELSNGGSLVVHRDSVVGLEACSGRLEIDHSPVRLVVMPIE